VTSDCDHRLQYLGDAAVGRQHPGALQPVQHDCLASRCTCCWLSTGCIRWPTCRCGRHCIAFHPHRGQFRLRGRNACGRSPIGASGLSCSACARTCSGYRSLPCTRTPAATLRAAGSRRYRSGRRSSSARDSHSAVEADDVVVLVFTQMRPEVWPLLMRLGVTSIPACAPRPRTARAETACRSARGRSCCSASPAA